MCAIRTELGPCRRSHYDDRLLVILSYDLYDLGRISLDSLPVAAIWLIAYLINDIFLFLILLRHSCKESSCLCNLCHRIPVVEYVPVDDHIHAEVGRIFHALVYLISKCRFAAARAIAVVFRCIHGKSYRINSPVVSQSLERRLVHIRISHIPVDTVCADSPELEFLAFGIHQICPLHRQSSMCRHRRLYLRSCKCITVRLYGNRCKYHCKCEQQSRESVSQFSTFHMFITPFSSQRNIYIS